MSKRRGPKTSQFSRTCTSEGCSNKPFVDWNRGHKDAGYCLKCGVDRWYKRFRARMGALEGLRRMAQEIAK